MHHVRRLLLTGGRVVLNTTLGLLLLAAGCVMLVTPGPGIVTIVLGFAVLAREYTWAERIKTAILARVKDASTRTRAKLAARRAEHRGTGVPTSLPELAPDPPVQDQDGPDPAARAC
ncbi:hypothetical protein FTX61_10800 [Nitriliruptoraceae bacterium ZYF776]|nr:hypothetical protein [Profundirhabdus halotolerans]